MRLHKCDQEPRDCLITIQTVGDLLTSPSGTFPSLPLVRTVKETWFKYQSGAVSSESEGESPPKGAAFRGRRKMFRQMAKQMGWTSDSDGETFREGEKDQSEGGEREKEERQKIREMRREMAWMPWMQMMSGRHHHHHRHHHRHSSPRHGDSPSRHHYHHHHDGHRRHHHHHEGGQHHAH